MPADLKPRGTCRKPKRESMSAPRRLSAGPVRNDSMRSPEASRKKTKIPKPMNAMHAMCERAWGYHRSGNAPIVCPTSTTNRSRRIKPVNSTFAEGFSAA
nr:putative integron gene cassette protein [uncultured bacterium]CAP48389.1 putative integron gene cassette protein [uncultured bacterium]